MGNIQSVSGQPAFGNEPLTSSREPSPAPVTELGQASVGPKGNAERAHVYAAFQTATAKKMAAALQGPSFRFRDLLDELHAVEIQLSTGPKERAPSKEALLNLLRVCSHLHTEIKNNPSLAEDRPKIRDAQKNWAELWPLVRLGIAGALPLETLKALLSSAAYLPPDQRSLLLKRIQKERASYKLNEFGTSTDPTFALALHATCPALEHFSDAERNAIFNDVMNTLGDEDKLAFFSAAENYLSAFSSSECNRAADFLLSGENKQRSQDLALRCLQPVFDRLSPEHQETLIDYVRADMN